jgi:outer membrane protein OmpA-like peptidoglycan-associated protein
MVDLRSAVGLTETDVEEVGLEGLLGAGIDLGPAWKVNVAAGLGLLQGYGVPTFRVLSGLRYEPSPNDPDHDGLRNRSRATTKQRDAHPDDNARSSPKPEEVAQNLDAVDDAERARAVRDGYDACPDLPEDYDGVEDDDGCPEGDADGDGVLDYLDRCPDEAETINGFEDDDGCKDEGPAKIVVEKGRLTILETIRFEPNSSVIDRESYPIMNQIALTLRKYREIEAIEIGGHTDSTGPHPFNMQLSRDRARSVRNYLLDRGIKPSRLRANGYGPDRPLATNDTDAGRAQNRRVEFLIVR